jgi:hypothetical protein
MDLMSAWWGGLQPANQFFYGAAAFFSVLFLWQLVSAILGLGSSHLDVDTNPDPGWDHASPADAHDTVMAFQLVSVRSILAFCTLFTWAAALYLDHSVPLGRALLYALAWGAAAMVLVSWLLHFMRRMTESGTMQIRTAVGASGTVHLDIPAGGLGEIRCLCSGVMTHFRARTADGTALKAGAVVTVSRVLGPNTVEVQPGPR